jgi:sugar phosphate isomerase/epimerase
MNLSLGGAGLNAGSLDTLGFAELAARHDFPGIDFGLSGAIAVAERLGGGQALTDALTALQVVPAVFGLEVEWRKDDATFQSGLAALAQKAPFARILGATRCVTWMLPATNEDPDLWTETVAARFGKIADILADSGVRLGLEWVGPHHLRAGGINATGAHAWVETLPQTLALIERIGRKNVGLLVDSYHCYTTGATEADLSALTDDQIVHVHINDAPRGVGPAGARDGERVLPGTGEIDLPAFLRGLQAAGFSGFISCEVLAPKPLGETPDQAAAAVRASLKGLGL